MAQTLNLGDKDIEMTNTLKLFGPEVVELLYPDREPVGDPIVDKTGEWKFNNEYSGLDTDGATGRIDKYQQTSSIRSYHRK